jgi:signal transduction histidine kinase
MPLPVVFIDSAHAIERAAYTDSLARVGIAVADNESVTTVISCDARHVRVITTCEELRLSRDIAPDDLAEFVRTVLTLAEARAKLRSSEDAERRALVASSVVHDANNALLPILFAARDLLEAGPDIAAAAQQVLESTNHIATMFRDFLRPRPAVAAMPIDINSAILRIMRLFESTGGHHTLVTTRLDLGIPSVVIDPNDLARVVINLVVNARESVADASPITVATSQARLSQCNSFGLPAGRWVLLEVEDRGAGMDQPTLARAVEPFFTTKRSTNGTGLGLSSALQIVRQAGGYLQIESTERVGTRVRVFLPA